MSVHSPSLLSLPALWNRFPLLEYDTGGYLARWYEGYLVPSRPAPYGLLLNLGAPFDFWTVVLLQAALAVWVLTLAMRAHGIRVDQAKVGDPITVTGTGRALDRGNGWTDWNISFEEFVKGSALS